MTETTTSIDTATTAATETPDLVVLSGQGIARVVELLDHCHTFLTSHPAARNELRAYCTNHPGGLSASWVIEQLAWHAALLHAQLAEQVVEDRRG